jgi:hypothetical protein
MDKRLNELKNLNSEPENSITKYYRFQ